MGKYGINVPRGAAAGSVQEVKDTLKNVFPSEKEVTMPQLPYVISSYTHGCKRPAAHGFFFCGQLPMDRVWQSFLC